MKKSEYTKVIENIIDKECERIMNEILDLYHRKIEVNKSFNELIEERIPSKYLCFSDLYNNKIVKLIPKDLYICPNNKWALVNEKEFHDILLEEEMKNNKNDNLKEIINKITEELINNENIDFFDTINKYLKIEDIYRSSSKYILEDIYDKLKKRGYTIMSITPFKINKD